MKTAIICLIVFAVVGAIGMLDPPAPKMEHRIWKPRRNIDGGLK